MTRASTPLLEQVLAAVPAALAYVAPDGEVQYENDRMAGLPADLRNSAFSACAAARVQGPMVAEAVYDDGVRALIWRFAFHAAGESDGLVIVGSDVTAERRIEARLEELLAEEQSARAMTEYEKLSLAQENVVLEQVASSDTLTGLVNRRAFAETLEQELAYGVETDLAVAVLYMDLDGFKAINDTRGHAAGDHLLVEIAHRLRGCVRGNDIAARLGGDEFALLLCRLPPAAAATVAERVAERVLATVREPVDLEGTLHAVGVSVGVALAPLGTVDADALVARADAAMYKAKRSGGCRAVTSDPTPGNAPSSNPLGGSTPHAAAEPW